MTALEFALGCHDILAAIFDHLAPGLPDGFEKTEVMRRSCRGVLASAALTCTTLSHHALNALWREIDTIHPLLRTLPNCKHIDSQFVFCGAISDEDWARFRLYADRVRAIVSPGLLIPFADPGSIHSSVWNFLGTRCKGSPMMPCLRYLLTVDIHLSEASALALLLSPSLRTFDIHFSLKGEQMSRQIAPHVVSSLMQTLPLMAPNLEVFKCEIDIRLGHEYLEAFSHFARLKTLTIHSDDGLEGGALRTLSTMGTLQNLTCTIDHSSTFTLALSPHTFPHLTSLNVMGRSDDLTAFLGSCNFPSLNRFTVRVKEPPGAGQFGHLFVAIRRRCNPTLLTSFTVGISYPFTVDWPRPSRLLEYFEPVLAFPNIKSFHLSFFHARPSIHDDDLARFGAAWRRLSSFHVSPLLFLSEPDAPDSAFARPTLSGLVNLARRCPHLETFRVPELDVTVVPNQTATLPIGHGLRTFRAWDVILPAPESTLYREAATVFDRVFPSMDLDGARLVMSHEKEWEEFLGKVEGMRPGRAAIEGEV